MSRADLIWMLNVSGVLPPCHGATENQFCAFERFAELVAASEREACASLEIEVVVPTRDYSSMTPLDCYESALIDQAIAFRAAIRARGQE